MELKMGFGKKMNNTWVFYWGPNESEDKLKIYSAKEAYGDFSNSGLKKLIVRVILYYR